MASGENEGLLKGTGAASNTTYGSDPVDQQALPESQQFEGGDHTMQDGTGTGGTTAKRERLTRNPSLDKVDEDLERELKEAEKEAEKAHAAKKLGGCPDYFGVKSYLHHFYETHVYKDPGVYEEDEEDEYRYLLSHHPRRHRCTSIWWKVFVWIGANFLVFGIIGVLVGYLVPQRPVEVGKMQDAPEIAIIDREAISFNLHLNVCKLVGLILFCVGGLTLTVALLFPSFLYQYCDDDHKDAPFKVYMSEEEKPLKSPIEMTIPATSKVSSVQPERKDEAIVTQEGMVDIKD